MKLVKTASGKKKLKISRKEWTSIGKKAGWMKKADEEMPSDERRKRSKWIRDVYHLAWNSTFEMGRRKREYSRVSVTGIGSPLLSITLGVDLGGSFKTVDLTEYYLNDDKDGAVNKIHEEMRELAQNPEFIERHEKTNKAIEQDMASYYAGGGKNWSGD